MPVWRRTGRPRRPAPATGTSSATPRRRSGFRARRLQSVPVSVPPVTGVIPDNLADLVGNTPMVRLTRIAPDCGAELIGKLEAYNPAGSVKDRIGVAMIDAAEAEGR